MISSDRGVSWDEIVDIKKDFEENFYEQQDNLQRILTDRGERAEQQKPNKFGYYLAKNMFQGSLYFSLLIITNSYYSR